MDFLTRGHMLADVSAIIDYIAIDSSGNVWGADGGVLIELVGAATPVTTPLSAATMNPLP